MTSPRSAGDLAVATRRGELEVQFQPQVRLADGHVSGTLAMLRWHHPSLGLLWPEQFLPDAEAAGLGPTLAVGLLLAAAREAASWPAPARSVWVEVTVGALADEVITRVATLARDAATVGTRAIGLHLTGSVLPGHGPRHDEIDVVSALAAAREAGVGLAISAVGAADAIEVLGLTPDELVLGSSVVRDLAGHPQLRREVAEVVARAHDQGCRVSAHGVQSWPEVEALLVVGVDAAFGYLFGGPQRADRLKWVLDEDNAEGAWRGSYLADTDIPPGYGVPWPPSGGARPLAPTG